MPESALILIRVATPGDAPALLALCRQLGFELSAAQLQQNLRQILEHPDKTVLVGVGEDNQPLAWAALELRALLEMPPMVEITGFVVDEAVRGHRVGNLLLAAAEGWAKARGVHALFLRSNTIRHEAHHFYLRQGYCVTKTQHVLVKQLPEQA